MEGSAEIHLVRIDGDREVVHGGLMTTKGAQSKVVAGADHPGVGGRLNGQRARDHQVESGEHQQHFEPDGEQPACRGKQLQAQQHNNDPERDPTRASVGVMLISGRFIAFFLSLGPPAFGEPRSPTGHRRERSPGASGAAAYPGWWYAATVLHAVFMRVGPELASGAIDTADPAVLTAPTTVSGDRGWMPQR